MKYPEFRGDEPCISIGFELFYADQSDHLYPILAGCCESCPSLEPCREWAIRHEAHGYWGGMTPADRKLYRSKRRIPFTDPVTMVSEWRRETA